MVEQLDEQGRLALAALGHRDPDKVSWARELYARHPRKFDAPSGVANVLRTGKSELIGEFQEAMLEVAKILGRRAALALENARLYELEQQARAQSEEAQRREELLVEVTTQLSASLDYPTTLRSVSRLIVPTYADFCIVLLSDGQRLRQVATAHRDEQQQRLLDDLPKHYETTLTNPLSLASTVWRSGEPMLLRELPATARAAPVIRPCGWLVPQEPA